jgi:hypothetical protein
MQQEEDTEALHGSAGSPPCRRRRGMLDTGLVVTAWELSRIATG